MAYKNYFYFDIETTSKSRTLFDLKLEDEIGYSLFIKKWEKMGKYEKEWEGEADKIYIEKAPLFPEYGKIICMSFGLFTENEEKKIMTLIEDDEEILLKRISKIINRSNDTKRILCGFNIKNFDLPFIIKKMHKYNIDLPLNINYVGLKPWEILIKDISEIWKGLGRSSASLEEVAYELETNSPSIIGGEKVHEYYWNNNKDIIIKKCEMDVDATIKIAEKLKI